MTAAYSLPEVPQDERPRRAERMRIAFVPPEHFDWIEKRTGLRLSTEARGVEAVDSRGVIRGMIVFDCWLQNSVMAHMAVDTPIAWRALIRPACALPFKGAGMGVVIGAIAADNLPSLRAAQHIGFRQACRISNGYAIGVDLLIHELRPEDCRKWLEA